MLAGTFCTRIVTSKKVLLHTPCIIVFTSTERAHTVTDRQRTCRGQNTRECLCQYVSLTFSSPPLRCQSGPVDICAINRKYKVAVLITINTDQSPMHYPVGRPTELLSIYTECLIWATIPIILMSLHQTAWHIRAQDKRGPRLLNAPHIIIWVTVGMKKV